MESNRSMKYALATPLLFATALSAQPTGKLDSDLTALSNPNISIAVVAGRITDDILAMADKDSLPSRRTVQDFAVELSKTLSKAIAGQTTPAKKFAPVSASILDVLQSSGVPSYRFHESIDRLRDALIALNASPTEAKIVAGRLMTVGQEIRGPEDHQLEHFLRIK